MDTHEFDKCPECRHWTTTGRKQWADWHRDHPIYDIDLNRPIGEIIEEVRHEITRTRGKINDAARAFTGPGESLDEVSGALTCALVALYNIKERYEGREGR